MTGNWAPENCHGLMFPGPPGLTVDTLQTHWQLSLAERAATALHRLEPNPLRTAAARILDGMAPLAKSRIFAHPLASEDVSHDVIADSPQRFFRHLIGAADVDSLAVVFTAEQIGEGLYLPQLHITLQSTEGEVLGLVQQGQRLQLVRGDGTALTLNTCRALPADIQHPLVRPEPTAGPFPVLNQLPEIQATWSHLQPASGHELHDSIQKLERGLALYLTLWPEAAGALHRHVGAMVLLQPRDYERSHSPTELCGTIFTTAGSPVMVGDLLAHEASHIRMHWFQAFDPMFRPQSGHDDEPRFISPWREDPRPLSGLTLGVHAFLNVCEWYRRVIKAQPDLAPQAPGIFARQMDHVHQGLATLRREGAPTRLGMQLLTEFGQADGRLRRHWVQASETEGVPS